MPARGRFKAPEREIDLGTLEFLQWVRHELSRQLRLKVPISGTSMQPTIHDGEAILIEAIEPSKVRIGDIVLYSSLSETAVIHRIINIEDSPYGRLITTRGDACRQSDIPVPIERVIGRVVEVERDGQTVELGKLAQSWHKRLRELLLRIKLWLKS